MKPLQGQVALITGAGSGIGRGIALRFAEQGAAVALLPQRGYPQPDGGGRGARTGRRHRAVIVLRGDLTVEEECHRVVREAAEWGGGRLTALVNDAVVQPVRDLPGMTADEWRAVLDTNLTSVFACTRAAAEVMRGRGSGSVTHIPSVEARMPAEVHAHYAAAKAAVVMHARSAAMEYGRDGIRVNTVSPGLIDRDGLARAWPEGVRRWNAATAVGRLGRPEDVGDACVFLSSPLASWITGHDLVADGGASARPTW